MRFVQEFTQEQLSKEIWKDIKGYEGLYQISNLGRVKALEKTIKSGELYRIVSNYKEKILKVDLANGYLVVSLCKNGTIKKISTHRLVALSFIGDSNLTVNHKNGIKTDNRIENLEWASHSDQQKHAIRAGLRKNQYLDTSINEEKALTIYTYYLSGFRQKDISEKLKIPSPTVSNYINFKQECSQKFKSIFNEDL
jgi:hypothetical protein